MMPDNTSAAFLPSSIPTVKAIGKNLRTYLMPIPRVTIDKN
jgi:hypothetical protein